jgi:putative transposase
MSAHASVGASYHSLTLCEHSVRNHVTQLDGYCAVPANTRWCSDGFEIACENGQTVTGTFTKDCCDREIIAWRAWCGRGLPGEAVREMLIEAVEARFGNVDACPASLQFLADNGWAYRAHETHAVARQLRITPIHTTGV